MTRPVSPDDPLLRSRHEDTKSRRTRCERALQRLVARGEPFTVAQVARLAGVGEKFPFRHPDLKAKIDTAKAQLDLAARPALDAALSAERDHWKAQATRLNAQLRRAVQRVGELEGERVSVERGLAPPADERDDLLADLAHLRSQLTLLRHRLSDQDAELAAVRRLNRDLVRENTRLQHDPTDTSASSSKPP